MKKCFHYRCRKCRARRSLKMRVTWYKIAPCCRCKNTTWTPDIFRDRKEYERDTCRCTGLPFPHKKGVATEFHPWGLLVCQHSEGYQHGKENETVT